MPATNCDQLIPDPLTFIIELRSDLAMMGSVLTKQSQTFARPATMKPCDLGLVFPRLDVLSLRSRRGGFSNISLSDGVAGQSSGTFHVPRRPAAATRQ